MWKKLWKWVLAHEVFVFLLAFTVFARLPTLFEPYWYGDEGIYLTIGHALRSGEIMYRDIFDHKPPLIYFLAAIADGDQYWFRFMALWWNVATVAVFYCLAYRLFPKKFALTVGLTIGFILLTNLPLLEGNIANAEIFFLLPTLLGTYLLFTTEKFSRRIFLAGLCFGIAGLFKIPALVEVGVWPFYWWAFARKEWLRRCVALGLGVVIPFAISFVYFGWYGVARDYIGAAAGINIWYVASWGSDNLGGVYVLKIRAIITFLTLVVVTIFAKKLGKVPMLVAGWLALAVFATLISGRPYPHYALQMTGVFALFVGSIFVAKHLRRYTLMGFLVLELLLTGLVLSGGDLKKVPFYSVTPYYSNMWAWATKTESKEDYFRRFDQAIPQIYEIASFVYSGSSDDDKIFVWGDQALIYALAKRVPVGKYTTKFHLKDFHAEDETLRHLEEEKPEYIISYGSENDLPGLIELLDGHYRAVKVVGSARIYRYIHL